ncbi:hypothetical protein KP509_28G041500 [Ceratopteris richardii]|uniref:Protein DETOXIFICATION n=1 Tax=Ceratopteris richardii TaxID=49495 RepID=A0A8T2RCR2_CERRI|nr:hypothetical protein KP509_28G041500 [Ceratopteris richardii]
MEHVNYLPSPRGHFTSSSKEKLNPKHKSKGYKMCFCWHFFWSELKLQLRLAGPLITNNFLQISVQIISLVFVGHLGELALSSSSLAISMANVMGICVMTGMASGLETLCGQAIGAKQYKLVGLYLQTGIIVLSVTAVFPSFLCGYMKAILVAFGQDELISQEAGRYSRFLIPSLFAQASLQPLIRILQVQSIVNPLVLCSGVAILSHVLLCRYLLYNTDLGFIGAAISTSICNWINVVLLYGYVMFSPACSMIRTPLSLKSLEYTKSFSKLALPSAAMICMRALEIAFHSFKIILLFPSSSLQWWCYEIFIVLSGLLPNPQLQTAALSACLNFSNLTFQIPFGLSGTISTRVSNELGAGQAKTAHNAVLVATLLTETQALLVSIFLLSCHNVLGYVFSGGRDVIKTFADLLQLLALSSFLDSNQALLSGITRGCGWQVLGAVINLGAFYMVAMPIGTCLGFLTQLRARGLWIGVICGPFVQIFVLGLITWRANWEEEATKARQHVLNNSMADRLPT